MTLDIDYILKILEQAYDQQKAVHAPLDHIMSSMEVLYDMQVTRGEGLDKLYSHMMCLKDAGFLECVLEGWYSTQADADPKDIGIEFGFHVMEEDGGLNYLGNTQYRLTMSGRLFYEIMSDPDRQIIAENGRSIPALEGVDLEMMKLTRPALLIALIKGMMDK